MSNDMYIPLEYRTEYCYCPKNPRALPIRSFLPPGPWQLVTYLLIYLYYVNHHAVLH